MFERFMQPVIFAHRGACAHAPENTLPSFEMAVEHQADAIELDAKLSSDGEVMVIHDQTVDRTTGNRGKVNELTLAELKQLDAGRSFDEKFKGVQIPTLDEVFEAVGQKVLVNVELTNYKSTRDQLVEQVVKVVKQHHMEDRVLFSSFFPGNLAKCRTLLPLTPVAQLCLPGLLGTITRSRFLRKVSPQVVHPYLADVSKSYVDKEHRAGRRIHVWTVNNEQDMRRMYAIGVDGVFTDDPLKARIVMEKM
jgi:glycerophosphoryl diester phosphodiesterase